MRRDQLDGVVAFLRVAERRSFTAAAAELGVTPAAVSHTIKQLETRIGVALFARTTRDVGLTEAGRRFLDHARPGLAQLSDAFEAARRLGDAPSGLLRLNVPRVALPPPARIAASTSRPSAARRPLKTTAAPSRAKASAVARPMPEVAPVITTTLPAKRPAGRAGACAAAGAAWQRRSRRRARRGPGSGGRRSGRSSRDPRGFGGAGSAAPVAKR